jgi:hypothetical protein
MNGSGILTEEEKREMLQDAGDARRRRAFAAAQRSSPGGTLDDYIDFLSHNMNLAGAWAPRITPIRDFRL